jgi:hypothetical protein
MSSKKKGGVQEGPLVKMLERQRVQQAAAEAKSSVLSELSGLENVLFNDSSTMSSTQKTCQSRGPLPLCQILFQ